ncbi:DUF3231 family protein [Shouchella shacheensis]|uniref:DUF3231 family protein n=1 Tax=Shouchella shacheensis TaxID=1649580 RepID=UPI00073FB982|nr:DUF3231 family protein [Shouchella shacheensis]
MEETIHTRLTSAEMSLIWSQYINDSATKQLITYFLTHVDDQGVREILETALQATEEHLDFLVALFTKESFPIPTGFTEEDVNAGAPRLFSDTYDLMFISHMTIVGMTAGALAVSLSTRADIVQFFRKTLSDGVKLNGAVKELQLERGVYVRPPYIPTPQDVTFASTQHYLGSLFGKQRSLNSIEMMHLYINTQTNVVGKSLILAFAQVTRSEELRQYFLRGKKIAQKHIDLFSDILVADDIPVLQTADTAVMDSKVAPFSDKLMLFLVSGMTAAGIGNYGTAMAANPRKDVGLKYARLLAEIALYAEDGANLLIKNEWLEEPPQAPDRDQLTK